MLKETEVSLMNLVRIATRRSPLARLQSEMVAEALVRAHSNIELQVQFVACDSPGDSESERGHLTRTVSQTLLDNRADIGVHSWKDIPTQYEKKTEVVGTLERADMRDLILFRKESIAAIKGSPNAITVLSSSTRRSTNLVDFFQVALPFKITQVRFKSIDGNVETRLRRLISGEGDALIVAKAAIDRLLESTDATLSEIRSFVRKVLSELKFIVVPLSVSPPAAAQGAIAIEARKEDQRTKALIQPIICHTCFDSVRKEREILSELGGGCQRSIGAAILPREYGEVRFIKGCSPSGKYYDVAEISRNEKLPRAINLDSIYISKREDTQIERCSETGALQGITSDTFIFCSKHSAWPKEYSAPEGCVVWTAGIKTWEALAKRGIWVNGSAEGLGEQEDPRIQALAPNLKRKIKLTHADAAKRQSGSARYEAIGTYRVIDNVPSASEYSSFTHFFWRSSDEFMRALDVVPAIKTGFHGCGPGRSLDTISKVISSTGKVAPYLSVQEFLAEVRPL